MGGFLALSAAAACVALGALAGRYLADREERLAAWGSALERMAMALRLGGEELPSLLRRGAAAGAPALSSLAERLEHDPAAPPDQLLREMNWEPLLRREEAAVLSDCLAALFSPELDRQARALARAAEEWERYVRAAREAKEKNSRLYRGLGWLAGAAVLILLC